MATGNQPIKLRDLTDLSRPQLQHYIKSFRRINLTEMAANGPTIELQAEMNRIISEYSYLELVGFWSTSKRGEEIYLIEWVQRECPGTVEEINALAEELGNAVMEQYEAKIAAKNETDSAPHPQKPVEVDPEALKREVNEPHQGLNRSEFVPVLVRVDGVVEFFTGKYGGDRDTLFSTDGSIPEALERFKAGNRSACELWRCEAKEVAEMRSRAAMNMTGEDVRNCCAVSISDFIS